MRVVYVTSSITYVRDNYLHLLKEVADPKRLPPGIRVIHVLFLRVPRLYVLRNVVGLLAIGAPHVSLALLRNLVQSQANDPRCAFLKRHGIPFASADNINDPATLDTLRALNPDLIVNMRTRNIYRKQVLTLPSIGCINIHHGLLPENRGTMCDLWAWYQKRPVGFTIHWMNEKIDDGHIIARQQIPVTDIRCYTDIPMRSSTYEGNVLLSCLAKLQQDPKFSLMPNICEKPLMKRNPTPAQILDIRHSGLSL